MPRSGRNSTYSCCPDFLSQLCFTGHGHHRRLYSRSFNPVEVDAGQFAPARRAAKMAAQPDAPSMSFYSFLAVALVILATPGPTNTILAACGATLGLKRARLLPFAEAAGYFLAVSAYLVLAQRVAHFPAAMPILKGVASAWLLFVAFRLWQRPVNAPTSNGHGSAFMRIFLTTILNPKAMLVGAVLVPPMPASMQLPA
eukprot:gene38594-50690_t